MKHIALILALLPLRAFAAEPISFNRDIRPILSAKCFACHGPDAEDREADLRLDTKEGAFADLGGYAAVVAGKPDDSELIVRIITDDQDDLMPPPDRKTPLTADEISLLTRWVREGAEYADHWAFEPVSRTEPPRVGIKISSPIDKFIAARLSVEGLSLSSEAASETLVRRLYLDLTGLPPSQDDVDAFVANPQSAFEPTIDRLMTTPAFAERMAMEWLDVARYADTNGYSIDDHRDMWGWRDWVIHAFQTNMPYDEFIRQQLAGDLMPNATDHMKVATGFLRNAMNTHEGGTIAEEYRVAEIADKIDTVSTAFMGLTMKCAQCHEHKYDPITQRDYYRFFAFFNTLSTNGRGATNGNTKPFIQIDPILHDKAEFEAALNQRIAMLEYLKADPTQLLGDARERWERETLAKAPPLLAASEPSAEVSGLDFPVPGKGEAKGLSWIWSNRPGTGEFAWFRKTFSLSEVPNQAQLYVSCDNEAEIWINGKYLGKNPDWREPSVFNMKSLLKQGENLIAVAAKDWTPGGGKAALVAAVAFPGKRYLVTDATWQVRSTKPSPDWKGSGPNAAKGFVKASVVARHGAAPWGNTFAKLGAGTTVVQQSALIAALRKPTSQRTDADNRTITAAFAKADGNMGKLVKSIDGEIGVIRKSLQSGKTTVMIMDSGSKRQTHMLIRGHYASKGDVVQPGIPGIFGTLPDSTQPNRLALANWLTDPKHPLTARVTVNRYWQMLFGTGIVKTTEDFGSQGEWPSHPELLDWLAADFIASGWDVRKLLKTMLMTRTWRQSSFASRELIQRDPNNRLLARSSRYRLPAESVRDNALAIGGLLDQRIGGPSVYPPQPIGLWKEVSHFGYPGFFSAQHFFPDRGYPTYRRSMYTFWKRTSPPPVMATFDAPNRETCSVRRSRTNTPLQALVLMNEPQFVEASRGLALRMLGSSGTIDDQIKHGFRLATARYPTAKEVTILKAAFDRQVGYFADSPSRITELLGVAAKPSEAAMATIASLILNLDETITRE